MEKQTNNTQNLIIGILIFLVLALGYLFIKQSALQESIKTGTSRPAQITNNNTIPDTNKNCLSAKETWNHIGETACVEFTVESPYQSGKGNVFLNEKKDYKNGFTVYIPSSSVSGFSGNPVSLYGYKTIQVTGLLRMYQGHPEIIANSPDQINVK